MARKNESMWLCEHARSLEKFSGQWVLFNTEKGVVSRGISLDQVLRKARRQKFHSSPFIFQVPQREAEPVGKATSSPSRARIRPSSISIQDFQRKRMIDIEIKKSKRS